MADAAVNRRRQFDICQRYRLLDRILQAAFPAGAVRVLDVGAGPDDLSRTFLDDRFAITLADTSSFGRDNITVVQPEAPLPFAERSFDAAIAMDVLEHLPPAARPGLVAELARVAKSVVVVSHPVASGAVVAAEALLAMAHRAWLQSDSSFLGEHARHGLPAASLADAALTRAGLRTAQFANCPLIDWLPFTVLDVALLAQFGAGARKDEFNLAANTLAGDLVARGDSYRTFVLGAREPATISRVNAAVAAAAIERTPAAEQAIADLLARAMASLADSPTVTALRAAIAAKDEHIGKLESLLQQRVHEAQVAIAAKNEHIRKLELKLHGGSADTGR
jgi:hypothetical protein